MKLNWLWKNYCSCIKRIPNQLKHLQNDEKIVIRNIYIIELAILDESKATQRKTYSEPQH